MTDLVGRARETENAVFPGLGERILRADRGTRVGDTRLRFVLLDAD